MAIRWSEFKANFKHYDSILADNEPIVLPRREAARRAVNREKRHKIQFDADEVAYAEFHKQLKRYREVVGNVTMAHHIMCEILATPTNEQLRALAGEDNA